jgi:opacity protein-like surface antigen
MKRMKTILAAALLMLSSTAMAQATYEAADGTKYEFQKHMFLNLEGGAQYTLGEAKFKDLISPNVQLGLGYQFSPVFGARLQANAWQSKGGWVADVLPADYKFKYVAPGIDLMFNLSNLFCGWNPNRVFNLTAFLGGGANIAFSNDEVNDIAAKIKNESLSHYNLDYLWDGTKVSPFGRAGLEAAFRLSDAVALTLEGNANILGDKYNSKKADHPDWYFNALIGLKINLGKTYNKILPPPPAPEPEPEPVFPPAPPPFFDPAPVVGDVKFRPFRLITFFLFNKTFFRTTRAQKVKA